MKQMRGSSVGVQVGVAPWLESRGDETHSESLRRSGVAVATVAQDSQGQVAQGSSGFVERCLDMTEVVGSSPAPATNIRPKRAFGDFGFRWAEGVGLSECPYLVRWVLTAFGYSIRLHHWLASDDQRHMHDHPWAYIAIIVRGGYTEIMPSTEDSFDVAAWRGAGSITSYRAEHRHTVKIASGETCWSLLLTGKNSRHWGFHIPGRKKLMRPLRYFSRFGHHPCE